MTKDDVGKPRGALAQGEETVRVAGEEFRAVWYETKGNTEVGETFTRTWMSDDVPQKVLKSITRVPASGLTMTLELTEIRRP